MTLLKYGIASVFVASAALLACGSSTDGGGAAGASNSNSGASSSSAGKGSGGSPAANGGSGGSTSSQAGGPTGSGGQCDSVTMDPSDGMCPAGVTCVETKCQSQFDASTSPTGPCGSYVQCRDACKCDQTCVGQCPQTSECEAALRASATCVQTNCLNAILSCVGAGTGGTGGSAKTCADLSACCATLTDAEKKIECTQAAAFNVDALCSLAYSGFCS